MTSIILLSVVAVLSCFGPIIVRNFFNVCKILTIYTDIYDIELYFQNFIRTNLNWMAGRSLDTSVREYVHLVAQRDPERLSC